MKNYLAQQFGTDKAKQGVKEITSTVRQLEHFPEEGLHLGELIDYPTDYRYLEVKPNYVFYRIEGDTVRIIRILSERQDFLQIWLRGESTHEWQRFWPAGGS